MAWKVEYDNSEHMGGGQWFEVVSGNGERLTWIPYSASDDEKEAARLKACMMAAAPDMYEVLEDILENYECGDIVDQKISKVLSKARGQK